MKLWKNYLRPAVTLMIICLLVGVAVAADFHLRKWRLLTWETENSKHSKCSYTCENRRGTTGIFLQNSKQIR